jgi:uncharacterized protein YndB with AHSA1/START domain
MVEYARVTQVFNAPVDKVWGAISAFGDIKRWVSAVDECVLESDGVTTVRVATAMGAVFRERLVRLDAGAHELVYAVEDPNILPFSGAEVTMSLHAVEPNSTKVEWVGRAHDCTLPLAQVAALIEPIYDQSLRNLKKLVEA